MRAVISRQTPWDIMVDMFFYRDPEEAEKCASRGFTEDERLLRKKAAQDIEQVEQLLPGVERTSVVKRTNASIEAAEEIVQSMELEARSMSGESKQQLAHPPGLSQQSTPGHAPQSFM